MLRRILARAFNRLPERLRVSLLLLGMLFQSSSWAAQVGAFSITNKQFATPAGSYVPAAHVELADQTLVAGTVTTAVQNTGIAGLKWIRVKGIVKTLGAFSATETMRVTVQAGTGAAVTSPVNIAQVLITMETGDTGHTFEMFGWSNAGFQSYQIIITCSDGAAVSVLDLMVDAA